MQEYITFFSNHPVLIMAWVGLLAALIYSYVQSKLSGLVSITSQEATQLINKEDAQIVDVRSIDEFNKGHISGAKHLPLAQIENNSVAAIENKKQIPIILVCESGTRTQKAAKNLLALGFEKIYQLRGGMAQWRADKLPVTKK